MLAPGGRTRRTTARHALTTAEAAWVAALPCALLTLAAVVLLGPPVGHALFAPRGGVLLPEVLQRPEPVEHGRYVVALLGPALLAGVVVLLSGRAVALNAAMLRALLAVAQWTLLAFLVACVLAQRGIVPGAVREPWSPLYRYFHLPTLATAATFALLLSLLLARPGAVARVRAGTVETRRRRVIWAVLAVAFTAAWLLRAVDSDGSFGNEPVLNLIPWQMDEAFAVLNGGTPLVDVQTDYSQLWSVIVAGAMVPFGASASTWTVAMASLSGLGLLSVFALLRRVVRNSLLALALYLPFTAISLWIVGPPRSGISIASIFSIWPMRYCGTSARLADRPAPRRRRAAARSPVFLLGGLVAINNLELGLGALGASCAALVLASLGRPRRAWVRLGVEAGIGLLVSAALVSALALARSGELPHPGLLLEFPRLFGVEGWVLEPMPTFGLHLAIYVTFAAALVVAAVRARQSAADPLLTSMLAWAGVFGLFAGSYYVGRSNPGNLIPIFSAWSLALALLLVAVVRALAAHPRRPTPAELATMLGFGLALPCVLNMPSPLAQLARLRHTTPQPVFRQPDAARFFGGSADRARRAGRRSSLRLGTASPISSGSSTSRRTRASKRCQRSRRCGARSRSPDAGASATCSSEPPGASGKKATTRRPS